MKQNIFLLPAFVILFGLRCTVSQSEAKGTPVRQQFYSTIAAAILNTFHFHNATLQFS